MSIRQTLRQEALQEGMRQGMQKGIQQTAKQMLRDGAAIEKVVKWTGLSEAELAQL